MSTEQSFLDDIIAHPDDDGIRLIFADWLEDQGHSDRAEFIRAQIQRHHLSRNDPRYEDLEERETLLLANHREEWAGRAARYVENYDFCRGMFESVSVSMAALNRHANRLYASAPISALVFTTLNLNRMAGIASCRHLSQIEHLDLSQTRWSADDMRQFGASPHLGRLRCLELAHNSLGKEGLEALLHSPLACRLTSLKLSRIGLCLQGNHAIRWPRLPRLEALDLSCNYLGPQQTREFAELDELPGLVSVNLSSNQMGIHGPALGRSPWLSHIKDLHLDDNDLGPDTLEAMAGNTRFRPRELSLEGNDIGPGVEALARSGTLSEVEWLDLRGTSLGAAGVIGLTAASDTPKLRRLWLSWNNLGDAGLQTLADWPGLRNVFNVELGENGITADGLSALLASPHVGRLRDLYLYGNKIGNEGAKILARWSGLAGLKTLNIEANGVTARGRQILQAAREWGEGLKIEQAT